MNSKRYNFNAMLPDWNGPQFYDCRMEMVGIAMRLWPTWSTEDLPGPDAMIAWLYDHRPEVARSIERKHELYPEDDTQVPVLYNLDYKC